MKKILFLLTVFALSFKLNCITELETREELDDAIKSNDKAIILFYGTCAHCNPANEIFAELYRQANEKQPNDLNIKFFKMKVHDKPVIQEDFGISKRPTFEIFHKGVYQPNKLEKEQINMESLIDLYRDLESL